MTSEGLELLRSIDASLKQLLAQSRAAAPKAVASDRDLDGPHGDPALKFMPRDWTGATFKGRRFSECPADLLDMVADTFDWFALQAEQKGETTSSGKPVAPYKRADAGRARGWAKRIREGRHVSSAQEPSPEWGDTGDEDGFR